MQRDRHAGDVHQLEGAHADAEGLLAGGLDGRDVGDPLVEQPHRLVQPGHEVAVDDEPRRVGGADRRLADALLQRVEQPSGPRGRSTLVGTTSTRRFLDGW